MSKKQSAKTDDFKLPEWLADDEYGSETFEVFTHPKTKQYLQARAAHDVARDEFDKLEAELLAPVDEELAPDVAVGDIDPRQERLEALAVEIGEAVAKVNELAPAVRETAHEIVVVDKLTLDELSELGNLESEGPFMELLAQVATIDGDELPAEGWRKLARKCGVGQWASLQHDVLEYLGTPGVTPDFSPLTSPTIRE